MLSRKQNQIPLYQLPTKKYTKPPKFYIVTKK